MNAWLIDTALYTGLLIGAVLVLRRPVGRLFGPGMAYAMWALPLLRFLLPPIVLPADMAPEQAPLDPALLYAAHDLPLAPPVAAEAAWQWSELAVLVWLAGAAALLAWRIAAYRTMRRDVLRGARPVGEVGRIRLVETPAVDSPVAFGVRDKVVALPDRFMAMEDRAARDLAIAHELAHHRGGDILANFAAQPLLAMHWFNPLAWAGWRAMRRDQEAACDARVMAGRGAEERVLYARLIAGFAAGPRLALAAPLACPMIGEKSIIHRLRSLSMTDVSTRRRWFGRALFGGAAIALPLTASISYAADEPPAVAQAPVPPSTAAVDPAAPAEPGVRVVKIVRDTGGDAGEATGDTKVTRERRVIRMTGPDGKDGDVQVFEWSSDKPLSPEQQARLDALSKRFEGADWEAFASEHARMAQRSADAAREGTDAAARAADMQQRRQQMALRMAEGARARDFVSNDCAEAGPEGKREWTDAEGRKRIVICQQRIADRAAMGLRAARNAIANNRDISADVRDEVLQELDAEIVRIEKQQG